MILAPRGIWPPARTVGISRSVKMLVVMLDEREDVGGKPEGS